MSELLLVLQSKESELQLVDQVLIDPTLTAPAYRSWRISNIIMLQEIRGSQAAGGAAASDRVQDPGSTGPEPSG